MKYECHFPNQHQKLYHISKAQPNTFYNRHPILLRFLSYLRCIPNAALSSLVFDVSSEFDV